MRLLFSIIAIKLLQTNTIKNYSVGKNGKGQLSILKLEQFLLILQYEIC